MEWSNSILRVKHRDTAYLSQAFYLSIAWHVSYLGSKENVWTKNQLFTVAFEENLLQIISRISQENQYN